MKKIKYIFIVIFCFLIFLKLQNVYAVSQYGSRGEEVKQIQTKLKNWGYYNGSIDGVYGSKTYEAVKNFQKKNGLTADGIAGSKTLAALGINSSSSSGGKSSNNSDLNLLAHLIYSQLVD